MIAISSTAAPPAAPGMLGRFVSWIRLPAKGVATYLQRRAAIKALHEMDDRGLRDIGLARCYVEAAVYGVQIRNSGGFDDDAAGIITRSPWHPMQSQNRGHRRIDPKQGGALGA
jgi:uncharacterized protein YjiS (DUF1127 family)